MTLITLLVAMACTLPAIAQSDETAKSFHLLPHLADGDGWQSVLLVTNVSQSASHCTFNVYGMSLDRFREFSGGTAAGLTATFQLEGNGDYLIWPTKNELAVASGYATLDCSAPVVAQVHLVFALFGGSGEPTGMATVFSSQAGTVFQFPVLQPAATLGFAIANDTNAEASCRIVLEDGQRTNLGEATLSVPVKSNRAQMLHAAISIPGTFLEGSATVSCDQQVAMIGLHFELRPDGSIITFNTLPPAILSTTPVVDSSPSTVIVSQRAALEALYDSASGPAWNASTNWKTAAPLSSWYGVRTDVGGRVVELNLQSNGLSGTIPAEVGNLTHLQKLSLSSNRLSGTIPAALGRLAHLQELYLIYNGLTGTIPAELGRLTGLQYLYLYNNALTGAIPAELGNLTGLQRLYLSSNELSGTIPAALGRLTHLQNLNLGSNRLSGTIPAALGRLAHLQELNLGSNRLSGTIPAELGNLTGLQRLYLSSNELSGTIPAELGRLTGLRYLYLYSNELSGTIPAELGNLTGLQRLYLYSNELSGTIPAELGRLTGLQYLYLYSNELSGTIPAELGRLTGLQYLYLYSNELSGTIPAELGRLTGLQYLYLYSNELSGTIPAELGNLVFLQQLRLNDNELSGTLPASLTNLRRLSVFMFDKNAGLCAPSTAAFQDWLNGIYSRSGPTCGN